jgi:hypothetical protein
MAKKSKYWEGWGFTDLIKVILTGKPKERNEAYNEVSKTFDEAQVEKVGTDKIEIYLPEHEIKNLKAMAKLFGLKVQYATGGVLPTEYYKTGGRPPMSVAEIILQQIGGMNRVVMMTGAYNFVAGSNYLAFKIKNRRANYIKITLNGKDLYDIEIGRIFGSKYNVVKSYNDVYFDQLIPLLEEGTGMYFRFAKGGTVKKKELTEGALLAPNGKPSNLTPEQYKLVRTKAFKDWFGDWEKDPKNASQVVDENGEPLVVYRGDSSASKKGNIFKTGFNRMGFINRDRLPNRFFHYFVDQYNVAKGYAENQVEDHNTEVEYSGKGKKWEAKVTPYFLNIRNAIDITPNNPLFPTFKQYKEAVKPTGGYSDPWDTSWYVPFWYGFDISKQYLHKILAEKIGDDYYYDDYYSKESNDRRKERILNDTYWGHTFGHFIEWKTQRQNSDWLWFVYQGLLKNKVDGLIFLEQTHWFFETSKSEKEKYEKGLLKLDPEVWRQKPKVYAALHSNQIKLADGSNTTFDPENLDIRFEDGGQVDILLAPNGKPSNLTPEQYRLVRTPAFKNWFGDWEKLAMTKLYDAGIDEISMKRLSDGVSKMVDSNGEPMVMYHGTPYGKFDVFEKNQIGKNYKEQPFGFYFTNIKTADQLRGYSAEEYSKKGKNPHIFEVFLNVKNPIEQQVFSERPAEAIDWEHTDLRNQIKKSVINSLTKGFKKYDGVTAKSSRTKELIAVALKSNQIKLADGSNTTFDPENPDIRFKKGGKIQPRDLTKMANFTNIYKGAEYYSLSDVQEKQQKADRWFELFVLNQKQRKLNKQEFQEFENLSKELAWEEFEEGGYLEQIANDPALEYAKGGRLLGYSFVTAYTDEGKKLYKLWKGQPTHQEVYRFFNKLNNSKGQKINIVDTEIETKAFSKFNREAFLKMANKVAMEQYGSGISDIDELIFTFDTESLNVFPFEAELENDLDVQISCVDGIVFITEIDD